MCYAFFEVSNFNNYFKLKKAYETNRKDVIKFAKSFALTDIFGTGFLGTLFTYPIQVGRIRYLTNNKKVFKTLYKFNNYTDDERQAFFEKLNKFLS
jgi:hypothetical protein